MQLLPEERVTLETGDRELRVTSIRVRHHTRAFGDDNIVSIMLDAASSCGLVRVSTPWLLLAAGVCILGALAVPSLRVVLLIAGALFVAVYFATRSHVLAIRSAGHTIQLSMAGVATAEMMKFIEAIEGAKNERYLLHVPLRVTAPDYSPAQGLGVKR